MEWAFHIGGDTVPAGTVFTFGNMSLICTDNDEYDYVPTQEWQRADIVTNQIGYFPDCRKQATLISDETDAVDFSLCDESGKEIMPGASDLWARIRTPAIRCTFWISQSLKKQEQTRFRQGTLPVGNLPSAEQKSTPAYISHASAYFYQNRSGIAGESQYITSGDAAALARSAGHSNDTARITTDWDDLQSNGGSQDVSGGWYDAGDHGKYVVNGGIALWMMQNQYERAVSRKTRNSYTDDTMQIPEQQNGYPDLLDEARWEMEWMLKMIVQDGTYQGMAYHKVHDIKWTALGMAPADDQEERILKPPTTCATLNLAACAAQAARLWGLYHADSPRSV